jgi:hypothetical protein
MALTINDDSMSGDHTWHTARLARGHQHAWEVSWLPGRLLDRNSAVTAMILADVAGSGSRYPGDRSWPHIEGWAAELGLTAPDALTWIAQPAGDISIEKHGDAQADPEAADS